jgi:hypothetical protein
MLKDHAMALGGKLRYLRQYRACSTLRSTRYYTPSIFVIAKKINFNQLSFCCALSQDKAKKQTAPERTFSRAHTVFGAVLAFAFIPHREPNFKPSVTL